MSMTFERILLAVSKRPIAFLISVGSHFLLFILVFSMSMHPQKTSISMKKSSHTPTFIQSEVIDPAQVAAAVEQLRWQKDAKRREMTAQLKELEKQSAHAEAHRLAEERHLAKLKVANMQAKEQHSQNTKALAKLQEQLAVTQKHLKAKQKSLLTEDLAHQIAKEQASLSSVQSSEAQKTIDKYKALIIQAIAKHWVMPDGKDQPLSCQLLLHVAPGGQVLDMKLLRASGDQVLDRSVRSAVMKASPLPVPKEASLFDKFRELRLTVRPEDRG